METTHCGHRGARQQNAIGVRRPTMRCSVILLARGQWQELDGYLQRLAQMNLPEDYEVIVGGRSISHPQVTLPPELPEVKMVRGADQLGEADQFDACAAQARGAYLLLIREPTGFDVRLLNESIGELRQCPNRMSVSATGKFVLAEKAYYLASGGFRALLECTNLPGSVAVSSTPGTMCRLRNLQNEYVSLCCGHNSVIDPDVVVDSPQSVKIGSNCVIRKGVVLRPEGGEIVIGDNCVINHYSVFHGKGGIYLGDWTIVAPHCGFYAQNHTYERFDLPVTRQPNIGKGIYVMGDNWIGAGVVVCDDVTIGKGAVVGANSTVTKSIPMASIALGAPARVVGMRHGDDWDFHQRERATRRSMPGKIVMYVLERARRIAEWIEIEDLVLDVGCGEGVVTERLAQECRQIVGCDYSVEAIETARKQCPRIEFAYSNSTFLRFPSDSFTKVVFSEVAEHLMPAQLPKTLREIHRVLRSGGTLVMATPLTGKGKSTSTYAHIYEYSAPEIVARLNEAFGNARVVDGEFGICVAQKRG